MEGRTETWKDNFLLHMDGQSHVNLKYSGPPILNQISTQLLDTVHHNINEICIFFPLKLQFVMGFLENIAPNVPFCNDIGHCLYILEYVHSRIYTGIIRKPIRSYSRPILWVIFTPFALRLYWKPPFLCLFGNNLPPFHYFSPLSHILHLCPPAMPS